MATYLASIRDRRVYPQTTAREIREKLESELPNDGIGFERLLETFQDVIVPMSRHNAHPRMFGYVQAPGTAIAAFADLLASTLNANLTAWRSAPAAVEVERLTIDWIKEILGYDAKAAGLFVSGGSMANMAALAAARQSKAPSDLLGKGARSLPQTMCVYCSEETHHSIDKAAALLGIGPAAHDAEARDQDARANRQDRQPRVAAHGQYQSSSGRHALDGQRADGCLPSFSSSLVNHFRVLSDIITFTSSRL